MEFKYVYINKEYFEYNKHFIEMLDPTNIIKQTQRKYIFLEFKYKENSILVPLRSEIVNIRKLGQISYSVPSESKPNAGLDYRKILIVNEERYIQEPRYIKISRTQQRVIEGEYNIIKNEIIKYIDGYIKSVNKNRQFIDKKYKFSTLHNFHMELGIIKDKDKEVAITKTNNIKDIIKNAVKKAEDHNKKVENKIKNGQVL